MRWQPNGATLTLNSSRKGRRPTRGCSGPRPLVMRALWIKVQLGKRPAAAEPPSRWTR